MNDSVRLEHCPNCGARLTGPYCTGCGQKVRPINPTMGHFLHELAQEVLNFDGKIFRSVWLLLTRPGFLTQEVLAGRRASYVAPVRLYLVFSIAYFGIATLAPTAGDFGLDTASQDNERAAELQTLAAHRDQLIAVVSDISEHWIPRAMFVLVPLFAALVMLLSGHRENHYPQHLYFALHTHAAWFFAGVVSAAGKMTLPGPFAVAVTQAGTIYVVGYFLLAFGRVYRPGVIGTLWRGAVAGSVYLLLVGATMVGLFLPRIWPIIREMGDL